MAAAMINGSSSSSGALLNGHNGEQTAGPSKLQTDASGVQPALNEPASYENGLDAFQHAQQEHDAAIVSHIYQSGFQQGNYADVQLFVLNRSYRLHRLILSRSPYLDHLIRSPHNGQIYVPLETLPHITDESFAIALGYLYGSASINLVSPSNARSVLATGCLLGGMDDLCTHAYELCKNSISIETLDDWLGFIQELPFPSSSSSSTDSPSASGAVSPLSATSPVPLPFGHGIHPHAALAHGLPPHLHDQLQFGGVPNGHSPHTTSSPTSPAPTSVSASIFGPYGPRLRDDVFQFLVIALPEQLTAANTANPAATTNALTDVYARLPFEYFKAAVESPDLPIGNSQERFKFAKTVVAARKRGIARDVEETVVLAFGGVGDSGSAVHVTRRMRGRRLLKVGGK